MPRVVNVLPQKSHVDMGFAALEGASVGSVVSPGAKSHSSMAKSLLLYELDYAQYVKEEGGATKTHSKHIQLASQIETRRRRRCRWSSRLAKGRSPFRTAIPCCISRKLSAAWTRPTGSSTPISRTKWTANIVLFGRGPLDPAH
jgi:hypothetical protein